MSDMRTDQSSDALWQWDQGIKYSIEGIKALLFINGGSAVALLTFIGNVKFGTPGAPSPAMVGNALGWFAAGTAAGVLAFFAGYLTQLMYGDDREWSARIFHYTTYVVVLLSVVSFCLGAYCARSSIVSPT